MDKKQANIEAKKIYNKWSKAKSDIEKKSKENGTWEKVGLDSNNHLFKKIDEEAKEELAKLSLQVNSE